MATFPSPVTRTTPKFPEPLSRKENYNLTFPSDILNGEKRNFYTQIQFVQYFGTYQLNFSGRANPTGGLKLPIPLKVDDNFVLQWSEVAGGKAATSVGIDFIKEKFGGLASAAIQLGSMGLGIGFGVAFNPLLFLQFQRPEFKEFTLSWVLTPRNEKESQTIKDIVTACKKAAAPTNWGPFMGYPDVALIKMHPGDLFGHMVFKPCIIKSVQASYTGSPTPAFYKNGAPAVVTLTLNLQEMQFWFKDEIT